ncbi:Rieske (2Fe-2S) protein [Streptomyces sp. NPDC000410]|uniref:Rieske (2Fe-2S) protein n=1 Tax=Streptomyces sp. NPDC000410 TaxID=3154254 RepID=UPI00332C0B07
MTMSPDSTARRTVLVAGAASLAAATTGCGGESGDDSGTEAPETPRQPSEVGGEPLGTTSEVPEGGGKVFKTQKVVVTQPTAGDFKAFTAICTHQGCTLNKVENGTIDCPCHGSKFSITDGSVTAGPAKQPLAAKKITVSGDKIVLA